VPRGLAPISAVLDEVAADRLVYPMVVVGLGISHLISQIVPIDGTDQDLKRIGPQRSRSVEESGLADGQIDPAASLRTYFGGPEHCQLELPRQLVALRRSTAPAPDTIPLNP
jgi:hypothetical protein